jgi:uncharacterized protein YabE (DUF348 family)
MRVAVLFIAAAGLSLIAASSRTSITLIVDGDPRAISTFARTVGGAIRESGVHLTTEDVVTPGRDQAVAPSGVIEIRRARDVTVDIDGRVQTLRTATRAAENIVGEAGIRLYPGDRVWVDGLPSQQLHDHPFVKERIRIERGYNLNVEEGGARRIVRSASPTLGGALWESGTRLRSADVVSPGSGTALTGSTGLHFDPARQVRITAGDTQVVSWATGVSVGDALASAGVPLVGLDYPEPSIDSPVPASGAIRVVRVSEAMEYQGELLDFKTRWEGSDQLEIDHQRILDTGEAGLRQTRARVRYEEGAATSRIDEPQWVAVPPRDRIMGYGKKIVVRTLDTPSGPLEYWRAVSMYATSYYPCGSGVPGKCFYGTSSGARVAKGIAAVTLPWFLSMRGQNVYVPGYGRAVFADVGGGIEGRFWIDLAYGSKEEYVSWHHWVTVYFLTPVPPEGSIVWVLQ